MDFSICNFMILARVKCPDFSGILKLKVNSNWVPIDVTERRFCEDSRGANELLSRTLGKSFLEQKSCFPRIFATNRVGSAMVLPNWMNTANWKRSPAAKYGIFCRRNELLLFSLLLPEWKWYLGQSDQKIVQKIVEKLQRNLFKKSGEFFGIFCRRNELLLFSLKENGILFKVTRKNV